MAGILLLGSAPVSLNRVTVNSQVAWINLAKSFDWPLDQTNMDTNGYPSGTLANALQCAPTLAANYLGRYIWKYTGAAAMQFSPPAIVYAGGAAIIGISPSATGDVSFNLTTL